MTLQKLSPKLENATESYLISLGSSRGSLTDDQFRVVAKYVKVRKSQPYHTVALMVFVAIKALLIVAVLMMAIYFVESAIPKNVKEVVFISPTGENRIPTIMIKTDFMIMNINILQA